MLFSVFVQKAKEGCQVLEFSQAVNARCSPMIVNNHAYQNGLVLQQCSIFVANSFLGAKHNLHIV